MPRTVKTVKDKDNNDVEVYADNCNICSKEMVFPKAEADRIEAMFPFVKEKIDNGSPCLECATNQEKQNDFRMFTEQEIEFIKNTITKQG